MTEEKARAAFRLRAGSKLARALSRAPRVQRSVDSLGFQLLRWKGERIARASSRYWERTVHGARFRFDVRQPQDLIALQSIDTLGGYEPRTTQLILDSLGPGGSFVDVGANQGYFSALAWVRVRPSGQVHAFEPNPSAARRARANFDLNDPGEGLRLHPVAVADHEGRSTLYVDRANDALASLRPQRGERLPVDTVTLDRATGSARIDVMKIDAEGSEVSVLRGAASSIDRSSGLRLAIEWNVRYADRQLWDILEGAFRVNRCSQLPGEGDLRPIRSWPEARRLPTCNLWCTRL